MFSMFVFEIFKKMSKFQVSNYNRYSFGRENCWFSGHLYFLCRQPDMSDQPELLSHIWSTDMQLSGSKANVNVMFLVVTNNLVKRKYSVSGSYQ